MTNTDGQIGDGRKRLEHEWMRARQPMYEPKRSGTFPEHTTGPDCWCGSHGTLEALLSNEHFAR